MPIIPEKYVVEDDQLDPVPRRLKKVGTGVKLAKEDSETAKTENRSNPQPGNRLRSKFGDFNRKKQCNSRKSQKRRN